MKFLYTFWFLNLRNQYKTYPREGNICDAPFVYYYLDISNVNQGAYQLVVTIKYNGSEKIQKFDFSVISDKKFFTKEMVAGILIVCLIFANFLWLTLRKKGHISDKKEDYSNKMDQLQDKLGKWNLIIK